MKTEMMERNNLESPANVIKYILGIPEKHWTTIVCDNLKKFQAKAQSKIEYY